MVVKLCDKRISIDHPMVCISAEFVGAILFIPDIWTRWVALYTLPFIAGAAHFWAIRKGFFFVGAGSELPVVWSVMLVVNPCWVMGLSAVVPSSVTRLQFKDA